MREYILDNFFSVCFAFACHGEWDGQVGEGLGKRRSLSGSKSRQSNSRNDQLARRSL